MQIRIAHPSEYELAIQAAQILSSAGENGHVLERPLPELEAVINDGTAAIAIRGRVLIGFAFYRPWNDGFVSISGLAVMPADQRRGIGSRMLDLLLDEVGTRFPFHHLFALSRSEHVHRVFRNRGFVSVDSEQLSHDPSFWSACLSCPHFCTRISRGRLSNRSAGSFCCCTGLLRPASG